MNVASVCFSGTVGGLELAPLRRLSELQAHGHKVVAVLPADATGLHHHATLLNVPFETITPRFPYLDVLAGRALRSIFTRHNTDVTIIARTKDVSTAMLGAGKRVATLLYQQMQSGRDRHDWFHNRVYTRLDGCVTITRKGYEELARCTGLNPAKMSVIPYGIDTERFSPTAISQNRGRDTFGIPHNAFVVGIVGGFNPGKGQKEFLQALLIVVKQEPELGERLHALLVGERPGDTGAYTEELRSLRSTLPFADRVHFRPFADDPRPAYAALDVFVLASHGETFGMVLQEALAMGVPSIGTDAGGVPEIVAHGESGLLVPAKDPAAIADALLKLYRKPALRKRLAANAREFVCNAYDFTRQYTAFEGALAEAIRRRTSV